MSSALRGQRSRIRVAWASAASRLRRVKARRWSVVHAPLTDDRLGFAIAECNAVDGHSDIPSYEGGWVSIRRSEIKMIAPTLIASREIENFLSQGTTKQSSGRYGWPFRACSGGHTNATNCAGISLETGSRDRLDPRTPAVPAIADPRSVHWRWVDCWPFSPWRHCCNAGRLFRCRLTPWAEALRPGAAPTCD